VHGAVLCACAGFSVPVSFEGIDCRGVAEGKVKRRHAVHMHRQHPLEILARLVLGTLVSTVVMIVLVASVSLRWAMRALHIRRASKVIEPESVDVGMPGSQDG
jgi:hypothetical protein